jgi:hypothetical protein
MQYIQEFYQVSIALSLLLLLLPRLLLLQCS